MERSPASLSRRQFVLGAGAAGLGLLAGCGRLPWQAQEPVRAPRIGFLSPGSAEATSHVVESFRQGLREHGYVEGQTIDIEWRFLAGRNEQLASVAAELVAIPVDLIVAGSVPAVRAARDATSTIPIVMSASSDPVGAGLIASLARPGRNVTGVTSQGRELTTKRLELLKETIPAGSHAAVLWNPRNPAKVSEFRDAEVAAEALGVRIQSIEVRGPDDFDGAFEFMTRAPTDMLLTLWDPLTAMQRTRIADFAAERRLPAMYGEREYVEAGGLMAYGPNNRAQFRRAAYYVDRILKGTKPADLPVEQPMTFEFVVNLKTARELGITFPQEILLQVTEVIQ